MEEDERERAGKAEGREEEEERASVCEREREPRGK